MKNIFLTGRLNTVLKSIYYSLSSEYHVQMTSEQPEVFSGMLKILRPEMIIICLVDMDQDSYPIFEEIHKNCKTMPVLIIGSDTEVGDIKEYMDGDHFQTLLRPVTTTQIMKEVSKTLYANGEEENADELSGLHEKMQKKNILIVDDSAVQLRAMRGILQDKYKVDMAKNSNAVMKLVEKTVPDMIFLDYDMPGADGKEIFEMLQNFEPTKGVPVVFLTGVRDRERIKAVLALKPAGYMLKPVEQEKIFKVIEEVLSGGRGGEYSPVVVSEDVL